MALPGQQKPRYDKNVYVDKVQALMEKHDGPLIQTWNRLAAADLEKLHDWIIKTTNRLVVATTAKQQGFGASHTNNVKQNPAAKPATANPQVKTP